MMKTASRPRSIVTAVIIAGAAIVAGCRAETASPPSRSPNQRSAQPTGTTARSIGDLIGEWRIVSIDGQKVRPPAANLDKRPASISFAPPFYGGSAGCNSLGGIGVIDGGHYFTAPGPQTLIGCPPDLMKLETAWNQTMRANPAILSTGRGSWQLRGGGHMLDLADRRPRSFARCRSSNRWRAQAGTCSRWMVIGLATNRMRPGSSAFRAAYGMQRMAAERRTDDFARRQGGSFRPAQNSRQLPGDARATPPTSGR